MAELDARRTEVLAHAAKRIQRQIRTYLTRKEFIALKRATIHFQKLWRGNLYRNDTNDHSFMVKIRSVSIICATTRLALFAYMLI